MYVSWMPWTWLNRTSGSPWWGKRAKVRRKLTAATSKTNFCLEQQEGTANRDQPLWPSSSFKTQCLTALSNIRIYHKVKKSIKVFKYSYPKTANTDTLIHFLPSFFFKHVYILHAYACKLRLQWIFLKLKTRIILHMQFYVLHFRPNIIFMHFPYH